MAIDIAGSVMIIPWIEARLGYANDNITAGEDNHHFNGWIAYNPNDLTIALEFDDFELNNEDLWDVMLLLNYQFVDWFGATIRYSHEDHEDDEVDRITLALLLQSLQNFGINLEYSHTDDEGDDEDEFYIEGLISF